MKIARVIDYETTDLPEAEAAEIIEVARLDVDLEARAVLPATAWRSFACPRGPVSPVARAAHHILDEELAEAPQMRDLWEPFFAGDVDVIVTHKADFERHFTPEINRPWIDTYKVARVVWPDAPIHSNQGLRYWLGLDVDRALASLAWIRDKSDMDEDTKFTAKYWFNKRARLQ